MTSIKSRLPRELSPRLSLAILGLFVTVSTLLRGRSLGQVRSIWIYPDELVYGTLARSLATTGHFALRGVATLAYPVGYPTVLAAAFVGRSPVAAYDTAKWLNALAMSLAAVPVYFLARRLLPPWLALLGAALTLLLPGMAYTGLLMSENAFFPIFLLECLVIVRALERPTALRQLLALILVAPLIAIRSEGLVLVPLLLGSMLLYAIAVAAHGPGGFVRNAFIQLKAFLFTWLLLPLAAIAIVGGEAVKGRPPTAFLGRYAGSLAAYPVERTLRYSVYQLIDLEFYLAVIAFVPAFFVAWALLTRVEVPRPHRAVAAVGALATVLFVLAAGAASQSSQGGPPHNYPRLPPNLHDRYCFYVTPLFLVLSLHWLRNRREFSNRYLIPLLVGASILPLVLPYADLTSNADFDALALLPWSNSLIAGRNVHYAMAVTAAILCLLLLPKRSTIGLLQVGLLAAFLWLMGTLAHREMAHASLLVPSSRLDDRSWIDKAVPHGEKVAVIWGPRGGASPGAVIKAEQALWRAELFNTSVARFFYLREPMHYDLPAAKARLVDGRLIVPPDSASPFRYALAASPLRIDGKVVGRDRKAGLVLYRLASPTG